MFNPGSNSYTWHTTDPDGNEVKVIWFVGDYGLLLSTSPDGEQWSTPQPMDKRWSIPDRSLETAESVARQFFREVAWTNDDD